MRQIIVPGDKSITHRALLFAGLARGRSRVEAPLCSLDARSTARVLRQLGAEVTPLRAATPVVIRGRGAFRRPESTLHCGNSGTTARLLTGMLAGHRFSARLTGDRSLRRRPMRRITEPLTRMGARFDPDFADRLPLTVRGGRLTGLRWELPVSSAQLKSAILLAGAVGGVRVAVREPAGISRDHTERMLRSLGFAVATADEWIELEPGAPFRAFDMTVPGDPSSAAFLVGAGLIGAGAVAVERVGLNPTRTGFLDVLRRMGAAIEVGLEGESLGEPLGSIQAAPGRLVATTVTAAEIPSLIDEIPLLAVVAARAEGTTVFHQVGELRVKESDRLALIAANLRRLGYQAEGEGNTLSVTGSDHPPRGTARTDGDHRIAMAFGVLGTVRGARVSVDDRDCAAVSFPGFFEVLRRLTGGR
ncbi:MAG: 3-phosphoshikimate 1-carboxyvinyltransferase [Gemmatimonadales bacterium]